MSESKIVTDVVEQFGTDVAVPPTPEGSELADVQALIAANDAALRRLAVTTGQTLSSDTVLRIQLSALLEHLFGGTEDPRRLVFERYMAGCFAKVIEQLEQQAGRATLLQGVRLDPNGGGR